jgi:hypothetical protein
MRRLLVATSRTVRFAVRFSSKTKPDQPSQFQLNRPVPPIKPEISSEDIDAIKDVFYKDNHLDEEV